MSLNYGNNIFSQSAISQFSVDKTISCISSNVFQFTNHSVGNNLSYKWDFKDGTYSSEVNPVKTFAQPGFYAVTLIATQGNIDYYFSKQITVAPEPVLSNIDIQKTFLGKSYTYISNSTITSGSMTYFWNFADGVSSSLINPTHTYKDTGDYDVELRATSNYGCMSVKSKLIRVTFRDSTAIVPTFSVNKINQCIENNNYVFTYTGDTSNITSISWEFGDAKVDSGLIVSKHYLNTGNYFVKLTVKSNGITYTNEKIISVNKIDASFSAIMQSDSTTFSFFATNIDNTNGKLFYWNFDDGCQSNNATVNHTFFKGSYNVGLKIIDSNGCLDSTNKNVVVNKTPATQVIAAFTVNDSFQCATSNKFIFKNNSTNSCNIKYLWNFGDGTTSALFEPTKTYSSAGIYKITLNVYAGSTIIKFEKNVEVTNTKIWLGKIDNNWLNVNNWMCGFPSKNDDIIIKSSARFFPTFNNNLLEVNNLIIESGVIINAINSTFKVYGNLTGKGILNATDSRLTLLGSSLQSIDAAINIATLIVDNVTGVVVNNTANDSIRIYQLLTLKNGNLNTGNRIILKSLPIKTARLDKVNTAGNNGTLTGEVTVERYCQNKRAWRFYTMPFANNGNNNRYTINNTLQAYTNITGPTGNGFDYLSPYYSLNAWSDANNKWDNVKNTYTSYTIGNTPNFANIPYFIFIRGNKSVAEAWVSSDVTFSFSGKLQTGDQQVNYTGRKKGNYLFLGNPYASSVDLAKVQTQSKGLSGNFYYWDPSLNANGAYVTISNKGNGIWITTPVAAQKDRYMQSGQAMLFELADTSGFVKFTEDAKTDTNYLNVFGSANNLMDKLTINLYKVSANGDKHLVDGAITLFNKNYDKKVDENDSKKVMNPQENIGFVNGDNVLAIEARPYVAGEDSLHIYTSGLTDTSNYAIEIIAEYFDTTVQQIILIDSNLQNKSSMFFKQSNWYYFNHQTNANNYNSRFSFVLKSTKLNNGEVKNFAVSKQNKNALLSWDVDAEQGVKQYQIQYSIDGTSFTTIATQVSNNNNLTNTYSFTDQLDGKVGKHYYRIKTILENDNELLGSTGMIEFVAPIIINKAFYVYPNPTKDKVHIHLYSEAEQWLTIEIIEPISGRIITTQYNNLYKGENNLSINLRDIKQLISGIYTINFLSNDMKLKPIHIMYNSK